MFENAITETGTSQSGGVSGGGGTAKIKLASDANTGAFAFEISGITE